MVHQTFNFLNNGDKTARQINNLITNHGNNYVVTNLTVQVYDGYITVSSSYIGDDIYCNQDYTDVKNSDVPAFLAKKLGLI